MIERGPFDPNDPFDATIEAMRVQILTVVEQSMHSDSYKQLSELDQLRAAMVAMTVALACMMRAFTARTNSRKLLIRTVRAFLPEAFRIADEIKANGDAMAATGVRRQ
ncbi:hypothetical protein [Ensifer sp. LCM 4579]|uniref:hypothetical protein n=1 Tax=Ensifer sp. LCM 4579 TaxID=1848292 RepID=UPI0008DA0C0B|nr:hypothetical protein [Ensifer sp. LCM 4579]OHV85916.1 hypothetical protein LCM4579_00715 [Ensifer sp. LCM 4579]